MAGITQHSGTAVPFDQANIDTDQIIPKQFLRWITRKGFGVNLFFDQRYIDGKTDQPNPDFVLNFPKHQGATFLLARENFGSGSSREHAQWALSDYGIKILVATSFADIFYANCIQNQILPAPLASHEMDILFDLVAQDSTTQLHVDLPNQILQCNEHSFSFSISEPHKYTLTSGLDTIGQTLLLKDSIEQFEKSRLPWQ